MLYPNVSHTSLSLGKDDMAQFTFFCKQMSSLVDIKALYPFVNVTRKE